MFLSEEPTKADVAMVFAAACEEQMLQRTLRGVELWHQGFVPSLLVTGGGELARRNPDAQRMAQNAREAGLPETSTGGRLILQHHGKRQSLASAAGTSGTTGVPQDGAARLLRVTHVAGAVDGEEEILTLKCSMQLFAGLEP